MMISNERRRPRLIFSAGRKDTNSLKAKIIVILTGAVSR